MKRARDLVLIMALFGLLIAFTVYGPGRNQAESGGREGSTYSLDDTGALGLQRWLRALGYDARNLEYAAWQIPDEAAVLFMIAPREEPITPEQADETLRWVRNGGTLILVQPDQPLAARPNALMDQLQAATVISDDVALEERATAAQPLLTNPPVLSVPVKTEAVLDLRRSDALPILQTRLGVTLAGVQEARGYVYLASSTYPFTNAGLREPGSAPLMLNLLARAPRGATVLFDEWHHGYRTPPTLRNIAIRQGWGWAVAYTALVLVLYIVLTGRRFGRAVPLRADVARRSSTEYIQSMAQLFRRAGKQQFMLDHYRSQFKRRLARPYGFAPPADDEAFVRELERYRGANDEQAARLRALLARLRAPTNDQQMIDHVRAADAFADAKGRVL